MPALKKPLTAPVRARKTPAKASPKKAAKPRKTTANASARRAPRPLRQWLYRRRRALSQGVAVVGILAGLGWAGYWSHSNDVPARVMTSLSESLGEVSRMAGLTVSEVVVVGRREASREDISVALGVRRDDPVLALDMTQARTRLEALGWVQSASITRRLPGDVHVHLVERRPFALWQRNKKLVLIDREGVEITTRGLTRFANLPTVAGRDAPEHVGALFDALATEPDLFPLVTAAVRIAGRRWDVRLDNDIVIRLPEDNPQQGWRRLAGLQRDHAILDRDLAAIDLRLEDRLIVRLGAKAAKLRRQPGKST
jgi:cell division protein FtsQ